MLSPYRVLDLTDERGHLCGYMLGALGAEVIAVEPPGGSRARRLQPFLSDGPDGERSLTHFAYNRGKKSVVLDLELDLDRRRLRQLLATADVLIESATPGRMDALGLGRDQLVEEFPHLVYVSVTAFGQTGPKAQWAATDLTVMASGATLSMTGDEDRPPVRVTVPQGFHFGAASAAAGAVAALIERARSGRGQHVDAAAQRTITLGTQAGLLSTGVGLPEPTRSAGGAVLGGIRLRLVYPAADGFVSITHVFGMPIGQNTANLMAWAHEEGHCDEAMRDKDWVGYAALLESGEETVEEWEAAKAAVAALTSSKTKAELLAGAMERKLLVAPIATPGDVVESEHFASRGFFEEVTHGATGKRFMVPGAFAKCSATPLRALGPAPLLGQHQDQDLAAARPARPDTAASVKPIGEPDNPLPLAGLRVLDLTWSIAGPHTIRLLADLGATVIKVESATKQDAARGFMPIHDNQPGLETSALFDTMAAGKRSVALNLAKPQGREVLADLVRWCDIAAESYSPRAMRAWGLDYDNLRALNPDVIMLSTCLAGQTGPLANFAGYGNLGAALAGFYGLAGWPDRDPAGPFGAYTDYTSTHFMAATVLAAIDHRRRTGEGQHIDLAQAEAAQHFLSPAFLDYSANGNVAERQGNRDAAMAPHGVYPVAGYDKWIAIACEGDAQWSALAELMSAGTATGEPDLGKDPGLARSAGRLERVDELDAMVAAWTATHDGHRLTELLQSVGVAAHIVATGADCLADPQMMDPDHFVRPPHPDRGCLIEYTRFVLGRTPSKVETRAPFLGEHTWETLTQILGYDDERVSELAAAEVLE